ncbi:50S ribosomal protein L16 [Candidatus Omnitrophota bacterium]
MPKRVKYRKSQRGKRRGLAIKGAAVAFGEYGLQATQNGWVTNTQIEAARVAITRHLGEAGKIWIRVFPDKSVTKKPAETRMGKGKGMPEYWVSVIKRGRILFELEGVLQDQAREALRLAAHKVSLGTKFVARKKH